MKAADSLSQVRQCKKCGFSEFDKRGTCKECNRRQALAWYYKNKERAIAAGKAYRAANPEKHAAVVAAYVAADPERKRLKDAAWYAANADHVSARKAAWAGKNPDARARWAENRRARKLDYPGQISQDVVKKLLILQRGKCACCGASLDAGFHLDHVMPLALGGTNTDDNIQLLTPKCNMKKHAKHPIDYMQSKGFLL